MAVENFEGRPEYTFFVLYADKNHIRRLKTALTGLFFMCPLLTYSRYSIPIINSP